MKAVTKNEKLIAVEDMLYNSFCGHNPKRENVILCGELMAETINNLFSFTITKSDVEKIVDKLESRMDFSMAI